MPVVVRYHLEQDTSVLENHVQKIKTTKEPLTFYENIDLSIKILSSLAERVHDQRNCFGGESFPQMMLIHVLNFLFPKNAGLAQRVCVTWRQTLTSPLARRLLSPSMAIEALYRGCWDTLHKPRSMTLLTLPFHERLLICDPNLHDLQIWNPEGILINQWDIGLDIHKVVANEQFICFNQNSTLGLLSLEGVNQEKDGIKCGHFGLHSSQQIEELKKPPREVQSWEIPHCNGLALDNEFIYVTSISSVFKYSLQKETRGRLISSFELKNNPESQLARRLAIFRNEIFIVDHAYACVEVYSKEGKFLRKWGKRGKNPGEFRDPWGIAVAEERVYVVDAGNTRIQVFNLSGDYLFQCQPPNTRKRWDLADICISDGKMYVSDWNHQVLVFKLRYS
jgi:hypothetical protein